MDAEAVGAVLAGGQGARIGGDKATVELRGRPLISYPIDALAGALHEIAVVAKRDTALPPLPPGVHVWLEPDAPRHPLAGLWYALQRAGERPVFVCAGDMPLVGTALVRELAFADPGDAPAVVPRAGGRLQPLCALYTPRALAPLTRADPSAPLLEAVASLRPLVVECGDELAFLNVNTPEQLELARAALAAT